MGVDERKVEIVASIMFRRTMGYLWELQEEENKNLWRMYAHEALTEAENA